MTRPQTSPEDEARLLGCIFVDRGESLPKALQAHVTAHTFADPRNVVIYLAMQAVLQDGGEISPEVILSILQARQQLDAAGGYKHLLAVSAAEATTANVDTYIRRLRNLEILRGAIAAAEDLKLKCAALRDEDPHTVIDPGIAKLLQVAAGMGSTTEDTWDQTLDKATVTLESMLSGGGIPEHQIIHWPWPRMDELFAPMQRSQFIVLAARPSVGKSSLARPIALAAAGRGKAVYFITLEVNPERVPLQMAAALSRVGLREASTALKPDQQSLRQALAALRGLPITLSQRDRTLARIVGRARALHTQGKLDLLVIDHGLLLDDVAQAKYSEQVAAISQVTKTLKKLAVELQIVVLLLWQLNRDSAKDENREPHLSDLRGSGSLEEDADKVIFIHRPSENPNTGEAQMMQQRVADHPTWFQNVIQAKGRDDGTTFMSFKFHRQTARFMELHEASAEARQRPPQKP